MLQDLQELWSRFEAYEYSNEVLMVLGGLLCIIAALKIVRVTAKKMCCVFCVKSYQAIYHRYKISKFCTLFIVLNNMRNRRLLYTAQHLI